MRRGKEFKRDRGPHDRNLLSEEQRMGDCLKDSRRREKTGEQIK